MTRHAKRSEPIQSRIVIGAEAIAKALGGRATGGTWIVRCPAHDDREPSLSIRHADDGKVLVHCFGGCGQGRIIAALRGRGLWANDGINPPAQEVRRTPVEHKPDPDDIRRRESAFVIWQRAKRAQGTLVEVYLASRGISMPTPDALRFHPGLKHPSGGSWPAMVALVTKGVDCQSIGIHRTFLAHDGNAKAPVEPQKMMLGPCRGGVVRLADPGASLMIGEGLETCLAAMEATGHPAWAALSISGLRALDLPKDVDDVIVLADGDEAGEAAAREAAFRWMRERRRVRIARPPRGADFNDVLLGGAVA